LNFACLIECIVLYFQVEIKM